MTFHTNYFLLRCNFPPQSRTHFFLPEDEYISLISLVRNPKKTAQRISVFFVRISEYGWKPNRNNIQFKNHKHNFCFRRPNGTLSVEGIN